MASKHWQTKRLKNDIKEFYREKCDGMHIVARDEDISVIHALVEGPVKTPYEKGFFYFVLRFPTSYPVKPPHVKLVTTGGNKVRFNPNLYACGKVCLSILGTWEGPAWSPVQTLLSVLMSIRSLMNEKPYHNEPGHEEQNANDDQKKKAEIYNDIITHETIRVAVIGMVDEKSADASNMPQQLKDVMISAFKKNYKFYEDLVKAKVSLDGKQTSDPYQDSRPKNFQYKQLLTKLEELKALYQISDSTAQTEPTTVQSYKEIVDKTLDVRPKDTDTWDDLMFDPIDPEDLVYKEDE